MNDLARGQGRWAAARHPATDDRWNGAGSGRHAFDEDAALTPIFHALQRGGWRRRQHEPAAAARTSITDPVDEFRRDPLTAPIPIQAMVPAPSRSQERANVAAHGYQPEGRMDMADRGRHHRRRETVGSHR